MSLSPRELRRRVEEAITGAMGPTSITSPAWLVSRFAWPAFPATGDTRVVSARSYAVGLVSTEVDPRARQARGTDGSDALATSIVSVRYTYALRADSHVADYDAALDGEADLVRAVLTLTPDPQLSIRLLGIQDRSVLADGALYAGDLRFAVLHGYPLDGAPTDA